MVVNQSAVSYYIQEAILISPSEVLKLFFFKPTSYCFSKWGTIAIFLECQFYSKIWKEVKNFSNLKVLSNISQAKSE